MKKGPKTWRDIKVGGKEHWLWRLLKPLLRRLPKHRLRRPSKPWLRRPSKPWLRRPSKPWLRPPAFRAWSLLALWVVAYVWLSALPRTEEDKAEGTPDERNAEQTEETAGNPAAAPDAEDELEQECKVFNFPDLKIKGLAKLIGEMWGLQLEYPDSAVSLTLKGMGLGGKTRAAILLDLLRPHSYGFFRQGNVVHVVKAEFKGTAEDKQPTAGRNAVKLSRFQVSFQAKVGEPLDLWVETNPLVRLRITAQPLYGEARTGREVGILVDARRDLEPWFQHKTEALVGQEASIEMKSRQVAWCTMTPQSIADQTISMKVEFYYEASVPSE